MLVYTVQYEDTSKRHSRRSPAPAGAGYLFVVLSSTPALLTGEVRTIDAHHVIIRLTFISMALRYHPIEGRTVVLYC